MDERDRLLEQYEDAWFALLMDGAAKAQGEELLRLNEQLKNDPAAEVPEEVRARCEKTIRDAFARKKLRRRGYSALRVLQRVAVAAVLGILMFSVAYAASEDVRVATLNAIIDVSEIRTQIRFKAADDSINDKSEGINNGISTTEYSNIQVDWLPEGYSLSYNYSDIYEDYVEYSDESGSLISIDITKSYDSLVYDIDTENCTEQTVMINDHAASLYIKDNDAIRQKCLENGMPQIWSELTVFWIDRDSQEIWDITATNINKDEIIRLAEGVHWKGNAAAEQAAKAEEYHIRLDWLPEGYEFEKGFTITIGDSVTYQSLSNGEIAIRFTQYSDGLTYQLNTEDTTQQEVTVQGHDATLYVVNDSMLKRRYADNGQTEIWSEMTVFWMDEENQVLARVTANNMTEAEILRLAEGVHWTP